MEPNKQAKAVAVEKIHPEPAAITPMMMFTATDILEWFAYDPQSGIVSWRKKPNRNIPIGRAAGFRWSGDGKNYYIRIGFKGGYVFAHTVGFVCMTGRLPDGVIDHGNGDGTDNCWDNISDVTHAVNMRNQRLNAKNRSGAMGVDFHAASGRWRARIIVDKCEHHLGVFASRNEAITARKDAERRFGFHENHGRVS